MTLTSSSFGAGAAFGAAPFTLGVLAVVGAYNVRQADLHHQKKCLIEQEFERRHEPIPKHRTKDEVAGVGIGVISLGLGHIVPGAVEHLAGHVCARLPFQELTRTFLPGDS
jgi:hypothetical protein